MEFTTILTSSVLAGIISAAISAWVSITLKNRDYRNEYYKRVIDKRMKAIEAVEVVLSLFTVTVSIVPTDSHASESNEKMYSFFLKNPYIKDEDAFVEADEKVGIQVIWLSLDSSHDYKTFVTLINKLRFEATYRSSLGEAKAIYLASHEEISALLSRLRLSIANDMSNLYDVEYFLAQRKKLYDFVKKD